MKILFDLLFCVDHYCQKYLNRELTREIRAKLSQHCKHEAAFFYSGDFKNTHCAICKKDLDTD